MNKNPSNKNRTKKKTKPPISKNSNNINSLKETLNKEQIKDF